MDDLKLKTPLIDWMKVYFEEVEKVKLYPLPNVCPEVFVKNGFREKVWKEIYTNLSFGETATYGDIAKRCGSAKASQVRNSLIFCDDIIESMSGSWNSHEDKPSISGHSLS